MSQKGAARASMEGWGLSGVAEQWSSGLRSPTLGLVMWSRDNVMKAKISQEGS